MTTTTAPAPTQDTETAPPPVRGPIRPSLALVGADWMTADVTSVADTAGRRQVSLASTYGDAWFSMYIYVTADEARELAAKWTQVADEIERTNV